MTAEARTSDDRPLIYMDHAATTPMRPEVVAAMRPYLESDFGNPSSLHAAGRRARDAVERARERVAGALGCKPLEVIFTSGGTEADNLALFGPAGARTAAGDGPGHLITSPIEHHAVAYAADRLAREGWEVTRLPVDGHGRVAPEAVEEAVREDTAVVSIILANNEIGTVQPVGEIARRLEGRGIVIHTDAVQAVGKVPCLPRDLGVDLLSISGHKIYGPKGVGCLYVRQGTRMDPVSVGGPHEFGRRAGTENVPGIVGFAVALELAVGDLEAHTAHCEGLRRRLLEGITGAIDGVTVHGHPEERHPGILSVGFEGVASEALVVHLDEAGVAVSSGSACTEEILAPSHVLLALGLPPEKAAAGVRFSLGRSNREAQIDVVLDLLTRLVPELRGGMSPPG